MNTTITISNLNAFLEKVKLSGKNDLYVKGVPILTIAIMNNCLTTVKTLVEQGTNINSIRKDKYGFGNTPLIDAVKYGHFEIVKFLLSKGADVNIENYVGNTALMIAVYYNQIDIIKSLLDHDANVNCLDKNNRSPLLIAASKGNLEVVKLLFEYGADIKHTDTDGDDAINYAVKGKAHHVAEYLIKNEE